MLGSFATLAWKKENGETEEMVTKLHLSHTVSTGYRMKN